MKQKAVTHLGTPELHKRYSIMIEGGKFPRSKVMDQTVFDRYLMDGIIDLRQHRAAEFLLNLAAKAGLWAKGTGCSLYFSDQPAKSVVPFGVIPFGNAMRKIKEELGSKCFDATRHVIIYNNDIRKKFGIFCFSKSMDFIGDKVMFFHKNPLRHLE